MWLAIKKRLNMKNVTLDLFIFYIYKRLYQRLFLPKSPPPKILFIMGCQRSGTSLLTRIFVRDLFSVVYRESSKLSSDDELKLRLNKLPVVQKEIERHHAKLIVAKPLVESQNAAHILQYFPSGYSLWAYRHYKDVAASSLKAFGDDVGVRDIRPFLNNDQTNWRSQNSSEETRAIIQKHYSKDMNAHDAAALFWFARNQLFFEQDLHEHPRVAMLRYEDFVVDPPKAIAQIYQFLNFEFPGKHILKEVHAKSVKKGNNIQLSTEIETLCQNLYERLEAVYMTQTGTGILEPTK